IPRPVASSPARPPPPCWLPAASASCSGTRRRTTRSRSPSQPSKALGDTARRSNRACAPQPGGVMTPSGRSAAESDQVVYADSAASLRKVCEQLADVERFALDTEFVGERTYLPALELIQVATPDDTALIDCRAVPSLEPFLALLGDARLEQVVHAGQQDLELFQSLTGSSPTPVIDTQVAAAMAGYGAQVGYAQLVERVLGVTVEKSETLTDWTRRPLTKA